MDKNAHALECTEVILPRPKRRKPNFQPIPEVKHESFIDTHRVPLRFGRLFKVAAAARVQFKRVPFEVGDMLVSRLEWGTPSKSFMHLFCRVEDIMVGEYASVIILQPWEKIPGKRRSALQVGLVGDKIGFTHDGTFVHVRPGIKERDRHCPFAIAASGIGEWRGAGVFFHLFDCGRSIIQDFVQIETD